MFISYTLYIKENVLTIAQSHMLKKYARTVHIISTLITQLSSLFLSPDVQVWFHYFLNAS